jgi:thioredoxin reductase
MTDTIKPRVRDGVPHCSETDCPQYDGKRCAVIGCRPFAICEPYVERMAKELASVVAERDRLREALAELVNCVEVLITTDYGTIAAGDAEVAMYSAANDARAALEETKR